MATASNKAKRFPTVVPQALVTANRRVTHLTLWREAARTNRIGTLDITDSAVVELGQTVTLPAGIITFTVPTPTNGTAFAATEAVKGIHGAAVFVDAHYGAPGNDHTANRIGEIGQAQFGNTDWTYS